MVRLKISSDHDLRQCLWPAELIIIMSLKTTERQKTPKICLRKYFSSFNILLTFLKALSNNVRIFIELYQILSTDFATENR